MISSEVTHTSDDGLLDSSSSIRGMTGLLRDGPEPDPLGQLLVFGSTAMETAQGIPYVPE